MLGGEEVDRLVDGHAQHVADRPPAELHAEHLRPIAAALTLLAGHVHILEEVHLQLLEAVALAGLAAAARHVERERAGAEAEGLRARQRGVDLADLVERLDVGHGIRAGRPTDRLLVDEADTLEVLEAGERVVGARRLELGLERTRHRPVERVVHERGLAGARHAGHHGERAERQAQRDVLEVVLAGAAQHELAAAGAARERQRNGLAARQVARRERVSRPPELRLRPGEHDLAAALARARPQLDHVVSALDEAAVVLDDDDGVAGLGELAAEVGQPHRVARVQADRGLVEDVERADQLGAELVGEVDPLRLAARQRPRLPAQREVAEPDPQQEGQLGAELAEDLAGDRRLPRRELQRAQDGGRLLDRERGELGDRHPGHPHRQRRRLQTRAAADRARRLAAVAREEHAHVQLVAVRLDLLEESIDAGEPAVALVDEGALGLAERVPRPRHVDAGAPGGFQQLALVPPARRVRPRLHGAAGERPRAIGHHQRLVVLEDVAEALALGAGAERMVEREQERLRPLQRGPAAAAAERLGEHPPAGVEQLDRDMAAALAQRTLHRLHEALALAGVEPVEHDGDGAVPGVRRRRGEIAGTAVDEHAREAAPREARPQLGWRQPGRHRQRKRDERAGAGVLAQQRVGDGLRRVRGGRAATLRAVNAADLRVEQPQVVVDLGRGADRGARGPDRVLLLQGHGRADLLDTIDVGAIDPIEEHPRVGRQRLDVAPLPLGEERVEGQGGFAGAGDAGDDGEPIVGNLEGDVLEVVLAGSLDPEPRGLGHSKRPPEKESLPEVV